MESNGNGKGVCSLPLVSLRGLDVCPACDWPAFQHPRWPGYVKPMTETVIVKDRDSKVVQRVEVPIQTDNGPCSKLQTDFASLNDVCHQCGFLGFGHAYPDTSLIETKATGPVVEFGTGFYRKPCDYKPGRPLRDPWQMSFPGMELDPAAGTGTKHDTGKQRWDLLPWDSVAGCVEVITFGAAKYSANNWKGLAGWRWRYFRATLSHLLAWWGGEYRDKESGLPHLYHVICNLVFMAHLDRRDNPNEYGP